MKSKEQDGVGPTSICNAMPIGDPPAYRPGNGRPLRVVPTHITYCTISFRRGYPSGENVARSPRGLFPQGSPKEERKMRMSFSPRVEELEKKLKPYFARMGGIVPDAPKEIQEAFEEYKKLVKEESWF